MGSKKKSTQTSTKISFGEPEGTVDAGSRIGDADIVQLLHDVSAAANRSLTAEEALRYAIERVCRATGWHAGFFWSVDDAGTAVLTQIAHLAEDVAPFPAGSVREEPAPEGIVGAVVRNGRPLWVSDITRTGRRAGRRAAGSSMKAVFAFPVEFERRLEGVLEFYSRAVMLRDGRIVEAMKNVGIQCGYVIGRRRLETRIAEMSVHEKQVLGADLHDTLGQQIAGIATLTATLKRQMTRSRDRVLIELLAESVEKAKSQLRSLTDGLSMFDLDAARLKPALAQLARRTSEGHSVRCRFVSRGTAPDDDFTATQVFHIASEAVHNAIRHSEGNDIRIRLERAPELVLSVSDNGRGLTEGAGSRDAMGIRIMRQRARLAGGVLTFEPAPGGGTTVRFAAVGQDLIRPRRNP